jgi:hypothetical protein
MAKRLREFNPEFRRVYRDFANTDDSYEGEIGPSDIRAKIDQALQPGEKSEPGDGLYNDGGPRP